MLNYAYRIQQKNLELHPTAALYTPPCDGEYGALHTWRKLVSNDAFISWAILNIGSILFTLDP